MQARPKAGPAVSLPLAVLLCFLLDIPLAVMALAFAAALVVANLTVEYVPTPLALDLDFNPTPRFSWQLSTTQTTYRIVVSSSAAGTSVVWDSGVVQSAATSQIPYASTNTSSAAALQPETEYEWNVCICTSSAGCSCSAPAMFSAAPSSTEWAAGAVWIGGFPQMRFNFSLPPQAVYRARLYVSGVGMFEPWVNGLRAGAPAGLRAGASVLSPGWATVPPVRVIAQAYDVGALLHPGAENVLGVRTGMGKYGYMVRRSLFSIWWGPILH
jgi:alpha-L-rhamnosidase